MKYQSQSKEVYLIFSTASRRPFLHCGYDVRHTELVHVVYTSLAWDMEWAASCSYKQCEQYYIINVVIDSNDLVLELCLQCVFRISANKTENL